ncbi:heme oxygenase (decycling) 1 [Entomortierella beljakovae]|nr:heme oxygenase (decycling) 1 [Entomortierella beljakovae]
MTLLSNELKESTKVLHAEAGRSKFMKHFFKGEVSMETYGRFLVSLYHVYSTLERVLDLHKDNEQVSLVYFPNELFRRKALEEDLEFYNGSEWREMLKTITPGQQAYINAIENCSNTSPELLIAHAYVRYLGDLSGGQVLSKRLQKFNDIPEDKGASFYRFDNVENQSQFKELFRIRLNQVEVSDELKDQIVQEAQNTFRRNIDLFAEFDPEFEGAALTEQEQNQNLAVLEKELNAYEGSQPKTSSTASLGSRLLSTFNPTGLWNSLVGGAQTVDA